jgi:hypothetical protein
MSLTTQGFKDTVVAGSAASAVLPGGATRDPGTASMVIVTASGRGTRSDGGLVALQHL